MGNTLSGTVLTKIERLKNVQRDLTREKNAIRRQMQSMAIKIQFQHSRMRMLYEQQAMSTQKVDSSFRMGQIADVSIILANSDRDLESLRGCVSQIDTVLASINDMIMNTQSRQILARTGRALERANRYNHEAQSAHPNSSTAAELLDSQDIAHINTEMRRASDVLESTQKTIETVREHNEDRRSFAAANLVKDPKAQMYVDQYNETYKNAISQEDDEISKRLGNLQRV
tara:strand:+ start:3237 stop:3923 length:687 start_codon:yes stop_codon:yes gene_type:complete